MRLVIYTATLLNVTNILDFAYMGALEIISNQTVQTVSLEITAVTVVLTARIVLTVYVIVLVFAMFAKTDILVITATFLVLKDV